MGSVKDSTTTCVTPPYKLVSFAFTANLEFPCSPFDDVFFPLFSPKTLQSASQVATTSYYAFLPNTADRRGIASLPTQRHSQYPCTAPTPKIFAGVSPNNKFQQVHEFIPYKRKLLNTTIASFHRPTAHKNLRTSKFRTH